MCNRLVKRVSKVRQATISRTSHVAHLSICKDSTEEIVARQVVVQSRQVINDHHTNLEGSTERIRGSPSKSGFSSLFKHLPRYGVGKVYIQQI
jgi:hypothetical protein